MDLLTGTATFLFTDIEGSTRLWEEHPAAMGDALARHDEIVRAAIGAGGGRIFKALGDSFCAAFSSAAHAIEAACQAQRALQAEEWGDIARLPVRMALYTGAAETREADYFGPPLNRCARILAAAHGGQTLLSRSTVSDLADEALPRGARLECLGWHRLRDLVRPEELYQLSHAELPSDFPPLRSLAAFTHNLPAQVTPLIGREAEIEEVRSGLAETRLLTLTGTGGVGKTRLAVQVGAELLDTHPGGVWFIDLASVSDASLVPQALLSTLGLREQPQRSLLDTVADSFQGRRTLLILDNCEHLIDGCAQVAGRLLTASPGAQVLATSREALRAEGEVVWPVPSLSVPGPAEVPELPVAALTQYAATRLFVDRARAAKPGFAVTDENAPMVAEICCRLDGIPLAIELAAARVRAMTLQAISARLDNRLGLLSSGRRSSSTRQQTLKALLDWSYDLLADEERAVFRRLAAFAGGWTLEAAERIVGGDGIAGGDVLDLLTSLVDKSLVVYEEEGEARYRLLGTLREYALAKLAETAEAAAVRSRHVSYFLEAVEREGVDERAHAMIESEQDNLLGALDWAHGQEDGVVPELRLVTALSGFWCARGPLSVGRKYTEEALVRAEGSDPALRAAALRAAGLCAYWQSDLRAARAHTAESLGLYREVGDESGIAASGAVLAGVALAEGATGESEQLALEALTTMRRCGDARGAADSLAILMAVARYRGEIAVARGYAEQALAAAREAGYPWMIAHCTKALGFLAWRVRDYGAADESFARYSEMVRGSENWFDIATALNCLGSMARLRGEYARAGELFRDSLAKSEAAGSPDLVANVQSNLGHLAWCEGDIAEARRLDVEALTTALDVGEVHTATLCIVRMAVVLCSEGAWRRAAVLFGAVGGLRGANLGPFMPPDQDVYEACDAQAREALGEAEFADAIRTGRAMSLGEALAFAHQS